MKTQTIREILWPKGKLAEVFANPDIQWVLGFITVEPKSGLESISFEPVTITRKEWEGWKK